MGALASGPRSITATRPYAYVVPAQNPKRSNSFSSKCSENFRGCLSISQQRERDPKIVPKRYLRAQASPPAWAHGGGQIVIGSTSSKGFPSSRISTATWNLTRSPANGHVLASPGRGKTVLRPSLAAQMGATSSADPALGGYPQFCSSRKSAAFRILGRYNASRRMRAATDARNLW